MSRETTAWHFNGNNYIEYCVAWLLRMTERRLSVTDFSLHKLHSVEIDGWQKYIQYASKLQSLEDERRKSQTVQQDDSGRCAVLKKAQGILTVNNVNFKIDLPASFYRAWTSSLWCAPMLRYLTKERGQIGQMWFVKSFRDPQMTHTDWFREVWIFLRLSVFLCTFQSN